MLSSICKNNPSQALMNKPSPTADPQLQPINQPELSWATSSPGFAWTHSKNGWHPDDKHYVRIEHCYASGSATGETVETDRRAMKYSSSGTGEVRRLSWITGTGPSG
ncbi:hypothetical protein ACJZ2D_008227 [Fusarium nematophilum]